MFTNEQFILKANQVHEYKYEYPEKYTKSHNLITITCTKHGDFEQKAYSHLAGHGCPKCFNQTKSELHKKKKSQFIKEANLIHQNKYNYEKVEYINSKTKVIITCNVHGDFQQTPQHHLKGSGCKNCSPKKENKKLSQFIEEANKIHNNKYNYNEYNGAHHKIEITCPDHGIFLQTPNSHLKGRGCPNCQWSNSSKLEKNWLDSLNIPIEKRNKIINIDGKKIKVDAFCQEANIVYEFYGDFWHGNPSRWNAELKNKKTNTTFGELYDMTIQRENFLKSKGFVVISIWESDFLKQTIKNKL
jgi:hypothetical protein